MSGLAGYDHWCAAIGGRRSVFYFRGETLIAVDTVSRAPDRMRRARRPTPAGRRPSPRRATTARWRRC
jgi:hypothetical protein